MPSEAKTGACLGRCGRPERRPSNSSASCRVLLAGNGRRLKELEQMLRIYFLQQWFNRSDPAVEEALYDSVVLRQFARIDLGSEPGGRDQQSARFATPHRHKPVGSS